MTRFTDIDPKLAAIAERLGARLSKNRPASPIPVNFEERRIDWISDGIRRAILIQPKFGLGGVIDQEHWRYVDLAWIAGARLEFQWEQIRVDFE